MSRLALPCAITALFAVVDVAAQRTIIVSASGGPGVDFTDVPPAIAAANEGDIVLVRNGTYSATEIVGKSLSLLGAGSVTLANLRVRGLASGQSVTVADVVVFTSFTLLQPGASDCAGRVLFERVSFGLQSSGTSGVRSTFQNVADLRCSSCSFPAFTSVVGSTTTMTDCTIVSSSLNLTGVSLSIVGGTTVLSRCTVVGQSEFGRVVPAPAIGMNGGTLLLTDTGSGRIAAGQATTVTQPSAIVGSGQVIRDPRVVVVAGSAPPISGPTDTIRPIPSLRALGARVGGNVEIDLAGAQGHAFALFLGLPGAPLQLPQFGGYVGLGSFAVAAQGVFGATSFQLSIPASSGLPPGFALAWQAIAADPLGNGQLSNVATYARPQ